VSVVTPADRVSAHDLPLAESLSAKGVEREKYHIITRALSTFAIFIEISRNYSPKFGMI